MAVIMPIDKRRFELIKFIKKVEDAKLVIFDNEWKDFGTTLREVGMKSKGAAVHVARHYQVSYPLTPSDIMKIPEHVRGYGIAGAMDSNKEFGYLHTLYMKDMISHANLIQAVEGWIAGDPNKIIVSFYEHQSFCLNNWAKEMIENALWGDSLRAAAKMAIIENQHIDWASHLIRHRQVGDPSNAVMDLFAAGLIMNPNYVIETIATDKVGCPASAAQRLRAKNHISKEEFKSFVRGAISGDPANVVKNSDLSLDKQFAMKIAENDLTESAPKLAIWLATQLGFDPKWAYETVQKSKFKSKIDIINSQILLDLINGHTEEYRQTKKSFYRDHYEH